MRKERKPRKALTALTRRLVLSALLLWLITMTAITWLEAEHNRAAARSIAERYFTLYSSGYGWAGETGYRVTKTSDPFLYSLVIDTHHYRGSQEGYGSEPSYQPVVFLRDEEGNILSHSTDFVHGPLTTGKNAPYLAAALEREYFLNYDNGKPKFPNDDFSDFWYELRLTGHWQGSRFHALTVDYYYGNGWEALYAVPDADTTGAETVILENFRLEEYHYGSPVTRNGVTYPSLAAFFDANSWEGGYIPGNSLLDTIEVAGQEFLAEDGKAYTLVAAVRIWPLCSAVERLKWFYLGTFVLSAALVLFLWRTLKKRLVAPVQEIHYRMSSGWDLPPFALEDKRWFSEARGLAEQYNQRQHDLYHRDKELSRLNKALEYAQEAEENRRQMTSAIAHELKTPLAVIHSYAEGLQERINEEKREQYLQVILSECERMDGMVLEMLDLSRLEAGKVKLARDTFSLEELARGTFERLALAVEAKELTVAFDVRCDAMVTADEARMGQVITNFATNAVKYTPHGGKITVTIKKVGFQTGFYVENQCPPLSREALSKVWDTFYRTDSARSGEGTGLGLAISKSIVELHGGQVGVRNTLSGVEFRFVI